MTHVTKISKIQRGPPVKVELTLVAGLFDTESLQDGIDQFYAWAEGTVFMEHDHANNAVDIFYNGDVYVIEPEVATW